MNEWIGLINKKDIYPAENNRQYKMTYQNSVFGEGQERLLYCTYYSIALAGTFA